MMNENRFNFNDKYIKLLGVNPTQKQLDLIRDKMYEKINKTFKKSSTNYKNILVNIQNFIHINIDYKEANTILNQIPMKYFKLVLYKNNFQIDYQFPFIKAITDECLSENEVDNYFKKKEYLIPDKSDNKGIIPCN